MLNLGKGWFAPCGRISWTSKTRLARRGASVALALMFVVQAAALVKLANEGDPPLELVRNCFQQDFRDCLLGPFDGFFLDLVLAGSQPMDLSARWAIGLTNADAT